MALENEKIGEMVGIDKMEKSQSHTIRNVYYILRLRYNLLSQSQMWDKKIIMCLFTAFECLVSNSNSENLVLKGTQ